MTNNIDRAADVIAPRINRNLAGQNQNMGSKQRETRWLTPAPIVEALGHFDLDPCGAPGHHLAEDTYLIDNGQDGMELPWYGRVWLNPPYGNLTAPFLGKLADHGQGTALVFARTETRMFFDHVWPRATAILFIKGRLTFLDAEKNKAAANAGAPSCLVAYGEYDAEMLAKSGLGRFVRLMPREEADSPFPANHAEEGDHADV